MGMRAFQNAGAPACLLGAFWPEKGRRSDSAPGTEAAMAAWFVVME